MMRAPAPGVSPVCTLSEKRDDEKRRSGLSEDELRVLRHEVRNALASASAYTQVLLRRSVQRADERDRLALAAILENVNCAVRLMDEPDLETHGEECHVPDVLRQAARQIPPERFADLDVRVQESESLVGRWDGRRLGEVLSNVLSNAAKYSPAGTPIEVDVTRRADRVCISVGDRGIGVPAHELEAIFEGHRTTAAREVASGSGIGLRLSRRLVEAEGGRMWAMSEPGRGSVFYIELPVDGPEHVFV